MNNQQSDYFVPDFIDDTIQCMKFVPVQNNNFLATGGWDNKLRIFNINCQIINNTINFEEAKITSNLQFGYQHSSPILSLSWEDLTGRIYTGCADGSINVVDMQKNSSNIIGQHKNGCKEVIYHSKYGILITGGWDGVVNIFDLRSQGPVCSYNFNNKVYSMSCVNDLLVVGLSEMFISYFNLQKLRNKIFEPELTFSSHLKYQTRKVCVFNDGKGFAEASIEGRVAIKNIPDINIKPMINQETKTIQGKDSMGKDDFAFRCHRDTKQNPVLVYSVNDIAFNPVYGTFCTVGSDGLYTIWDKNNRTRLYERCFPNGQVDKMPLTGCDYNFDGTLLAFGAGYDWHLGAEGCKQYPNGGKVGIHFLTSGQRKK